MKIIAIGDIHGRAVWEKIIMTNESDIIVFIGDYFDSKENISAKKQVENFEKIISYKKLNPAQIILLIGNHDYHYLNNVSDRYSGFQSKYARVLNTLLEKAIANNLMQMCYVHNTFLFTHAGVTKTWYYRFFEKNTGDGNTIMNNINSLFSQNREAFSFAPGINNDESGDDITQSPIWVRPPSLFEDALPGHTCIAGHTQVYKITIRPSFIFIDTLGTAKQFLMIDNDKIVVKDYTLY